MAPEVAEAAAAAAATKATVEAGAAEVAGAAAALDRPRVAVAGDRAVAVDRAGEARVLAEAAEARAESGRNSAHGGR